MTGYRVTKFNPKFRKENGVYTKKEWTSISDIGRTFSGRRLTLAEYLNTEDTYVESVRRFLAATRVTRLKLTGMELKDRSNLPVSLRKEASSKHSQLAKKRVVLGQDIDWIVRLNLRECLWCRLEGEKGTYVHFGYDYYMYLGINAGAFKLPPLPTGIYAEIVDSPHYPE